MQTKYPKKQKSKIVLNNANKSQTELKDVLTEQNYQIEELKQKTKKSEYNNAYFDSRTEYYEKAYKKALDLEYNLGITNSHAANAHSRIDAIDLQLKTIVANGETNTVDLSTLTETVNSNTSRIRTNELNICDLMNTSQQQTQDIENINTQVSENATRISTLEQNAGSAGNDELENQISQISTQVGSNTSRIDVLEQNVNNTDISTLQQSINTISTQVEQNTQDIADIKSNGTGGGESCNCAEDVAELKSQVAYLKQYVVAPDPYYTGTAPSDFPAGTIYKTFDEDIKNFELKSNSTLNFPETYFFAEIGSSGTIRIEEKFHLETTLSNVQIIISLNDNIIYSDIFKVDEINAEQIFYQEFAGLSLNQNAKGNKLNITMNLQQASGSKTLVCTRQKIEIIGSNPEIITKICPFAVDSYNDKYYFSDCSNGTTKISNIVGENLLNIDNLTWTDTQVYAQYYRQVPMFENYGSNYIVKEIGNYQISYDGNLYVNTPSTEWTGTFTSMQIDYVHLGISNAMNFVACDSFGKQLKAPRANMLTNSYSYQTGAVLNSFVIMGAKALYPIDNNVPARFFTIIDNNGNAYFKNSIMANSGTNFLNLGFATYVCAYIKTYTSASKYTFDIVLKRYGKFYKYSYSFASSTYTLISSTELGTYDYYFSLPNNDYCIVNNGRLSYHKLP